MGGKPAIHPIKGGVHIRLGGPGRAHNTAYTYNQSYMNPPCNPKGIGLGGGFMLLWPCHTPKGPPQGVPRGVNKAPWVAPWVYGFLGVWAEPIQPAQKTAIPYKTNLKEVSSLLQWGLLCRRAAFKLSSAKF
jgi:hypothetical protein